LFHDTDEGAISRGIDDLFFGLVSSTSGWFLPEKCAIVSPMQISLQMHRRCKLACRCIANAN